MMLLYSRVPFVCVWLNSLGRQCLWGLWTIFMLQCISEHLILTHTTTTAIWVFWEINYLYLTEISTRRKSRSCLMTLSLSVSYERRSIQIHLLGDFIYITQLCLWRPACKPRMNFLLRTTGVDTNYTPYQLIVCSSALIEVFVMQNVLNPYFQIRSSLLISF